MFIVTVLFIVLLILFYMVPKFRTLRTHFALPHGSAILAWGVAVALGALVITVAIPATNLYLMRQADAPYIFQQWSRISKFYYLGIFVALIPVLYTLWLWYLASQSRFKTLLLTTLFLCGIASSSFGFEVTQFAAGYKNFEKAYIPQALSGLPDDIKPNEYREVCPILARLGATVGSEIISADFAFRYYCKANLYVTYEEGGAYQQLTRADVVTWYSQYITQSEALKGGDPKKILTFMSSVGDHFVIVSNTPKNASLVAFKDWEATSTAKFIILKIQN